MREIKFRAWEKINKIMLPVLCIDFEGVSIRYGEPSFISEIDNGCWLLKDVEIIQFTGLLDKNGKEIYDKDFIRTKELNLIKIDIEIIFKANKANDEYFIVYYYDKERDRLVFFSLKDCEYAGNIYENPELLEAMK